jgi:hypothetical protein
MMLVRSGLFFGLLWANRISFDAVLSRAVDGCSFMSLVLLFILVASQSDIKSLQYPVASIGCGCA